MQASAATPVLSSYLSSFSSDFNFFLFLAFYFVIYLLFIFCFLKPCDYGIYLSFLLFPPLSLYFYERPS